MDRRFEGKVALITGAASGIGRAVTLRLSAEGATVFAVDLSAEGLAATAAAAEGPVTTATGDVSDPAVCRSVVEQCIAAHGRLDVLGNIAGIARADHFTELSIENYRKLMGVNLDGPVFLSQAAIPHLLETKGNIVNMASNAGLMGQAYTVAYCMSKGALIQLTRSLAMEYVKQGIRVNAIAPGGVETALSANYSGPTDIDFSLMAPYVGHRGMAQADEIANMFALVASDDGRSMHGSIISIDNGVTAG